MWIYLKPLLFILLAFIIYNLPVIFKSNIFRDQKTSLLIIGILSDPVHFEERQVLRQTWLNLTHGLSVNYYFIIGDTLCDVPENYRQNRYGCEETSINLPNTTTRETEFSTSKKTNEIKETVASTGFCFNSNADVIIKGLQLSRVASRGIGIVHVDIISPHDGSTILSTIFEAQEGYKSVAHLKLPKHFDICIVSNISNIRRPKCGNLSWNFSPGVINYISVVDDNVRRPRHLDLQSCCQLSVQYSIADPEALFRSIADKPRKFKEKAKENQIIYEKLVMENDKYKDVLFLESTTDVYNQLTSKVLNFVHSMVTTQQFDFLLKTDDDTFVDLTEVYLQLEELSRSTDVRSQLLMWASFRRYWMVQHAGRHRDDLYLSASYPPYPCGGGYVMSRAVAEYLSRSKSWLTQFQGEDVSMGIWLAGLSVQNHQSVGSCTWACEPAHGSDVPCNKLQLSAAEMQAVYFKYLQQGSLT